MPLLGLPGRCAVVPAGNVRYPVSLIVKFFKLDAISYPVNVPGALNVIIVNCPFVETTVLAPVVVPE